MSQRFPESPIQYAIQSPLQSPIQSPIQSPTQSAVRSPIQSRSVDLQHQSPTQSPLRSPIQSPTIPPRSHWRFSSNEFFLHTIVSSNCHDLQIVVFYRSTIISNTICNNVRLDYNVRFPMVIYKLSV